ncbi:MAG TPA: polyphosphate:AMP phosphotransferase [Polyangiaceae bacterium]|jgi:polyphosphate:AMP phosphotransferase|nr:polyphosphate:AMP phosphotransferase [Polyangiaceae bacterium]
MFEAAELGRSIEQAEYDARVPQLRTSLLAAQEQLKQAAPFSVVIVIAGVDGAGKGETVNTLHEWMDARYMQTHAFGAPSEEERERPAMWRFWRALPPKGRIGIFFGSWYTDPIIDRTYGKTSDAEFQVDLRHIQDFERMLAEDGTLVLKYWFHLSKQAQKRRLKKLSNDPELSWRVGPQDWEHFERYDDFKATSERALRETSTGVAPWQVIEGANARYRELTCAEHLLTHLQRHLQDAEAQNNAKAEIKAKAAKAPERTSKASSKRQKAPAASKDQPTVLDGIDLGATLDEARYEEQLVHWQGKLNRLSRKAAEVGATMLAVFEGADAAGKGGAIRRLTRALDARYYQVVPIAAPSEEERAHHYLWRFWRHLPRAGHLLLFDRSWYGRVLVERVEGFAAEAEWRRAYNEITEFEELLDEHGIGLVKFWLHIDRDEQARRFAERKKTPYKEFKITEEDLRNRAKWPLYEAAVHEMVERTSTTSAPWHLIPANDKHYARIAVIENTCAELERCIDAVKAARKKKRRRRD